MERETRNHLEWECQQLLNRVTLLMDSGQWQELAACYTEDALLFRPSDPNNGVQGREAILASFHNRPPRTSCHLLGNCVFEVRSPDYVVANSKVWLMVGTATKHFPTSADSKLLAGSFNDQLVNIGGQWLIRQRRGSIELQHDYTTHRV